MKKTIIGAIILLYSGLLSAQILEPVTWAFSSKKTGENTYQLMATATMDNAWHIYSQYTDEGGPFPTEFVFTKNNTIILKGKPKEQGELIEKFESVFMVDTRYYDGSVTFVQEIRTKTDKPVTLEGYVTFMACNDDMCLPPTEVEFEVVLN